MSPAKRIRRLSSCTSDTSVNGPLGPVVDSPSASLEAFDEPEVFTSSSDDEEIGGMEGFGGLGGNAEIKPSYKSTLAEFRKLFPLYYTLLALGGILHRPRASRFEALLTSFLGALVVVFSSAVSAKVVLDLLGPIACAGISAIAVMNICVHIFLASTLQRPSYVIVYICDSARVFGRQSKVGRYLFRVNGGIASFSILLTVCGLLLVWRGNHTPSTRLFLWVSVGVSTPIMGLSLSAFASLHILVCLLFKIELRHYTMKVFASAVSPNAAFSWGRMLRSHMGAFSRSFGLVLATISAILIMTSFPLLISSLSHWRAFRSMVGIDQFIRAIVVSSLFLLCFLFILLFFVPPAILHSSCLDHINQLNLAYASFDFEASSPSTRSKRANSIRASRSFKQISSAKLVTSWTPLQFGHFVNFNKNCDFGYQILGQTMTMAASVNVIYALASIHVVIATVAMRYSPSF